MSRENTWSKLIVSKNMTGEGFQYCDFDIVEIVLYGIKLQIGCLRPVIKDLLLQIVTKEITESAVKKLFFKVSGISQMVSEAYSGPC